MSSLRLIKEGLRHKDDAPSADALRMRRKSKAETARRRYRALREKGMAQADAMRQVGISRPTAYRVDREYSLGRGGGQPQRHDPESEEILVREAPVEDPLDHPLAASYGPRPEEIEVKITVDGPGGSGGLPFDGQGWKLDTAHGVGFDPIAPAEEIPEGHPVLVNESYIPGFTGKKIDPGFASDLPGPPARTPSGQDRARARATRRPAPW
jgi:hypothetical protein